MRAGTEVTDGGRARDGRDRGRRGLAGLAASAYLAREGRDVVLVEKAAAVGGRARTQSDDGFQFNLGAHALYRRGAAAGRCRSSACLVAGGRPTGQGGCADAGKAMHTLPVGFVSLLTTGPLAPREKMEARAALRGPPARRRGTLRGRTLSSCAGPRSLALAVREIAGSHRSRGHVHERSRPDERGRRPGQMQRAVASGVLYLHPRLADTRGRTPESGGGCGRCRSSSATPPSRSSRAPRSGAMRLDDGRTLASGAVLVAGSPDTVVRLVAAAGGSGLASEWATRARPVRAASLDVALRELPRAQATFALGIDEPLYASVHSAVGDLGPEGGAVVHVMRHGGLAGETAAAVERQRWRDSSTRFSRAGARAWSGRGSCPTSSSRTQPAAALGGRRGRSRPLACPTCPASTWPAIGSDPKACSPTRAWPAPAPPPAPSGPGRRAPPPRPERDGA